MAQKHLHELLKEDQEQFYTANKRFHLKTLNFSSSLPMKKTQKLINQTPISNFCKNTCFFSFHDSPDLRKTPLYLPSPAPEKSPANGKFVLHVPARTAALLLEAAVRIQKQQSSSKSKVKFGVFGSILKKLKDRNGNKNGENSRINSEINEEKLMDLENYSDDGEFSSSPLSPFRFSLQRCSSISDDIMPEFISPAASPVCHKEEDKENYETIIGLARINDKVVQEEDEKEQCSPVSVLDPPFEEDNGHEDEDEDDDLDCSYALVQRAQEQLLYKLRKFEKLAELDSIELEKLLVEEEEENDEEEEYQVSNLILEEKNLKYGEREWQEIRANSMVKSNLKSEFDDWNEFQEQREETAIEFAFAILGLLVEELGEELIHLPNV